MTLDVSFGTDTMVSEISSKKSIKDETNEKNKITILESERE